MQLSAAADVESAIWDVAVDGRWLGDGPGEAPVVAFPDFDATRIGSARLLVIWLSDGDTYQLRALRPPNAKGQDKDEITVVLPPSRSDMEVFDPRLSTEYDANGIPQRFGVELWLGTDSDGDQTPLRLAGEADGSTPGLGEGSVSVQPMRAHGASGEGVGLYLMVQP